ncbi:MAG: tRNA (cytidine(34)-2'-O)-methyltransferase [Isosphaeraceae bacterium]
MSDETGSGPILNVVLVRPRIAANTGAIGRTCVAAGAKLWLVRPLGFHLDDRHRRRAGLDYWEHLDRAIVDDLDAIDREFGPGRLWLFETGPGPLYSDVRYVAGDALVFGSEDQGLPPSWLASHADRVVRIPTRPEARSLNLANSVAIGLYEALRQIGFPQPPG